MLQAKSPFTTSDISLRLMSDVANGARFGARYGARFLSVSVTT